MKWKKLGQLFTVTNTNAFLLTHASNPLPVHLDDNVFRIFYSGRNAQNRSSVGYVDMDIITLETINYPKDPIIMFGNESSFYSHGISIGNLYEVNGKKYILFMGWQVEKAQHWRGDIGRIQLMDNGSMKVEPEIPFLTADGEDPVSLSYPWVMRHEGIYKMWYGSTISWSSENAEMIHVIKYATSPDAEKWTKHGIAIPYEIGVAQAFSRPCVVVNGTGYHMWYSYRSGTGEKYRIGYAHSNDGITWQRRHQETGISVSAEGWDSEMVCYPYVFKHHNQLYMLYNGNSYGKEGFGLAVLEF